MGKKGDRVKIEGQIKISLEDFEINNSSEFITNPFNVGIKKSLIEKVLILPPVDSSHFGDKFISFSELQENYDNNSLSLFFEILKKIGVNRHFLFGFFSRNLLLYVAAHDWQQNFLRMPTIFFPQFRQKFSLLL